jgi:hypothetical protein
MQATLLTRRTACLVLAWFIAFVAVSGMAQWVQAQPMDPSICTSAGPMKLDPYGASGSNQHDGHKLKCFLCAGLDAPPAAATVLPLSAVGLGVALLPLVSARLAGRTRPPLPARGPPLFS